MRSKADLTAAERAKLDVAYAAYDQARARGELEVLSCLADVIGNLERQIFGPPPAEASAPTPLDELLDSGNVVHLSDKGCF